jgi:drug/metabolite transporter (DMT)-like permease
MPYAGEIASLLTAACWASNAVLFARAGQRVGSATVNALRIAVALVVMALLQLATAGTLFPAGAGAAHLGWLALSGLIGYALGDAMLFEAYVLLGPRLAVLIYTLWPVFAALLAWAFLGQTMGLGKALAMTVTLAGIFLVVAEKTQAAPGQARAHRSPLGLLLAVGGAAGQAVGFLFSRFGMAGGLGPVSANLVRVLAGALALWGWQLFRGQLGPNLGRLRDTRAALLIGLGALFGPVVGVVLSLYAINHARYLGVASTLMSLCPVMLLPFSVWIEKERLGPLAVVGTLVAIGGAAFMF